VVTLVQQRRETGVQVHVAGAVGTYADAFVASG
jgi:hypothetical protein